MPQLTNFPHIEWVLPIALNIFHIENPQSSLGMPRIECGIPGMIVVKYVQKDNYCSVSSHMLLRSVKGFELSVDYLKIIQETIKWV